MSGRLEGNTTVITGGASGMGRATALRFLAEGASVLVADSDEAAGENTIALAVASGHGDRARFVRVDVSAENDVEEMFATAMEAFGRVDCVFNNAGSGGAVGSVIETDVRDWDATFATLARGVFLGIKHGARAMVENGIQGSIINTASVAGFSGGDAPVAYSSAKAAVIAMTRVSAVELAPHRIRVNCLCPGGIDTPLLRSGLRGHDEEAIQSFLTELQPWPEPGNGDHIAGTALFLACEDSRFVTGQALIVDGGLTTLGAGMGSRFHAMRECAQIRGGLLNATRGEGPES